MNRLLSKISAPLLVGSILALGAMAWPAHAADPERPQYVFRSMQTGVLPYLVADAGDEGAPAEPPEPEGQPFVQVTYGDGWVFECETAWTAADLDRYRPLIETQSDGTRDPVTNEVVYDGTLPADGAVGGDLAGILGFVFRGQHSIFAFEWDGEDFDMQINLPLPGDPRDWPPNADGKSSPCVHGGVAEMTGIGAVDDFRQLDVESVGLVYR